MGDERADAEAGCLISFSVRHAEQAATFASLVHRILQGEDPGRMPFALPGLSELTANRSTAKALGVALPPDFVRRANAVID